MTEEPSTRPPARRYVRAGAADLELEDRTNATVTSPIRIQNCGPLGSASFTRTLEPGTRVEILEETRGPEGLVRILFPGGGDRGTLVDVEDIESDPDADRSDG